MVYLWRAVDDEGTVLDVVVKHKRNTKAATRLLRKLLRNQGVKPTRIVTDRLGSYGAALKLLGLKHLQDVGGRKNNRAECSHVPHQKKRTKITEIQVGPSSSKTAFDPRSDLQSV